MRQKSLKRLKNHKLKKLYYKERRLSARNYLRVILLKGLSETQFWKSNPLSFLISF